MPGFTTEILERKQKVQADLDRINLQREALEKTLAALDTILEWEQGFNGTPEDATGSPNGAVKTPVIPVTQEVARVLEEHPDWKSLNRGDQMRHIHEQLLMENYDFRGRNGFLSVGFALTQLKLGKGLKQGGDGLKSNDGSPSHE